MSQVALFHCDSIEDISETVDKIVDSLGYEKVKKLFQNKRVLLKPNLCIDHSPEKGATTHPAVLEAVINLGKHFNAEIIVGDGAAVGVPGNVALRTGVEEICRKHDVQFIDFNRGEGELVNVKDALALNEMIIAKTYFEVDTIVNMPVFKSNMLFWVSGALKNMKGFLVGMEKHKPHYLGVAQCVADVNRTLKQDLIIMDGYVGMMGDGPTAGKPANARLIMGGFDPVSVDALAASLMGLPVGKIPMLQYSYKADVGELDFITVGDPINSFDINFEKPTIARNRLKASIFHVVSKFFFKNAEMKSRMVIDADKCILCLRCKDMCPFHAISVMNKEVIIDREKCEFCLCCTEVCRTEAIKLNGMLAGKEAFLK